LFSQNSKQWVFIGVRIVDKVGCINEPYTQFETHWIVRDESFTKKVEDLCAELKTRYEGRSVSLDMFSSTGNKPKVVALIERKRECNMYKDGKKMVSSLIFYSGKDEADIVKQAESEMKTYPEIKGYSIVKQFDFQTEIAVLEKKQTKGTGSSKLVKEEIIDGLKIKYTIVTYTNGKTAAMMQVTNPFKDKLAAVVIAYPQDNNSVGRLEEGQHFKTIVEVIEPGYTVTKSVQFPISDISVTYEAIKPGQLKTPTMIDRIKQIVKEQVTLDEKGKLKKVKTTPHSSGIRG
jgi:hypothetical protein